MKFKTLSIFVLLNLVYCVSNSKYESLLKSYEESKLENQRILEEKVNLSRSLNELKRIQEESELRIQEYRRLIATFRSLIDAGKLKIKIIDGRMVVVLSSDILFPVGSAFLSSAGIASIREVTTLLASLGGKRFQIEGHTDDTPTGIKGYTNWELASSRALNVLHTMIKAGMPEERISAASMGASRPALPNTSPENRSANRRIEIVIVPDLTNLPGMDELKKYSN
ncbi:flagellar motor protein MotB [Leptospira borgpetersenii serovar Hardjo-bovis]|uniref:OmpA family protein n=1 Tax=Leptospira borgpetersenii serovar Hardjo-bovis str. Sponselee TaxID=1303729 RepID=M6BHL5_LEPBO|nr:flagellar motor protein MotB [Leptospira borgpetersenii]ABJ78146.1 Endoflagellar motor protein [Leptospira borgpetersenii serovar Hardjo-bovis str. L550]AMX57347.1 endoflagellar motor protein [Leptospira borgpetersenii serovar Hardjo]AMX60578.1 endoflagellar motor protein [Leptospira borgpetersenii serovar Hardjo]AMX63824.1 endoflagellar motor protein [Leptospira borgpetersenii serovar Hardjo]AMX67064.1 endoflagellar motor protein [Leptospira borgpetersenii serovar Hardjo]